MSQKVPSICDNLGLDIYWTRPQYKGMTKEEIEKLQEDESNYLNLHK